MKQSTLRNVCSYTCVGEMSISLFFSCLTRKEKAAAIWLLITRKIHYLGNRIMPCFEQEASTQRDVFLHRLSEYASRSKQVHFSDYSKAIDITEHWARANVRYVACMQTLLKTIYGERADKLAEAYLRWHKAAHAKKYQYELEIALCWEGCFCHGNAIRAYKRACEVTDDPEQQEFCLQAIARIEHDMMTIY